MRKSRRFFQQVGGAITAFLGVALGGYSWATTISDLPPLIGSWQWGIGIGFFLVVAGLFVFTWRLIGDYLWTEPEIKLLPNVEEKQVGDRYLKNAVLVMNNSEELSVTECYATLEYSAILYGSDMVPVELDKKDRLKWLEQKYASEKCEMEIPPHGERRIDVGDSTNGFNFSYCNKVGLNYSHGTGVRIIKIRVDGKFNGKSMKPLFWNGYIYTENKIDNFEYVVTTREQKPDGEVIETKKPGAELLHYTLMLFDEGDWKKDKRISKK